MVLVVLVGQDNPASRPWHKHFLVLDQERLGAPLKPVFLAESQFFGTGSGIASVENSYEDPVLILRNLFSLFVGNFVHTRNNRSRTCLTKHCQLVKLHDQWHNSSLWNVFLKTKVKKLLNVELYAFHFKLADKITRTLISSASETRLPSPSGGGWQSASCLL